jgi:hypothetical protein
VRVGDLVKHKGHGNVYIVAGLNGTASKLIGIWSKDGVRWVHKNWIEVVSCAKDKK